MSFDANPCLAHLTQARADSLRFGDRLPYFGRNVRGITDRGNGTLVVRLLPLVGQERKEVRMYAGDMVHVIRAGACRGEQEDVA